MKQEFLALQREEAERRIDELTEAFHLNPNIKKYFREGKVYYSYITGGIIGSIDTIEYDARYAQVVKDFEKRTGGLVYHAIELYHTLSLLYVSKNQEDWPNERLTKNYISAFVYDFDDPDWPEYGDIFVSQYEESGVLIRVG